MFKTLGAIVIAGMIASSGAGCQTIDRFVLKDGFECEAYQGDKKMVLYKDGEKFSRAEFNDSLSVEVYAENPNFDYLTAISLYEKCRGMLLEKYPGK